MFAWMEVRADIAASFQRVALAHLEERTRRAAAWALDSEPGIRHLVVAGGVAANKLLRSKLQVVLCATVCPCSTHFRFRSYGCEGHLLHGKQVVVSLIN